MLLTSFGYGIGYMDEKTEPMSGVDGLVTRRRAITAATAIGAAGVLGAAGIWHSSQPALAADVSAWEADEDEVSITTNDGTIDEVLIDPVATVEWSGFDAGENYDIEVFIDVELPDDDQSAEEVLDETIQNVDSSGEVTDVLDGDQVDITGEPEIDEETFEEDVDGETNATDVEVTLRVESDNPDVDDATATDTVTVEVKNANPDVDSSGSFTAAVESDEEVDD